MQPSKQQVSNEEPHSNEQLSLPGLFDAGGDGVNESQQDSLEQGSPQQEERFRMPRGGVALVACVGKKLGRPAPAGAIYDSAWFRKARSLIESRGWRWRILSAQHGLLHPETVIEPYEKTLNRMPAGERRAWAKRVYNAILNEFRPSVPLVFFAGRRYREYLMEYLQPEYGIFVPMEGLGIGKQLRWLGQQL